MRRQGPVFHAMPAPNIHVGMRLDPFPVTGWVRRRLLRSMIADHLRITRSLRRKGYLKREPGTKTLSDHTKGMIRDYMRVVDTAYMIEVAGVHGEGHHLGLQPVNQCYVDGGTGWSGMTFYGQLLWRAQIGDDHVAVLQPPETVRFGFADREILKHQYRREPCPNTAS
ncbi:hypothetical protein [Rhizobium laguerreae]|uniref:hypothetical protein n=1 Tax=Rhizobium laguerreae TaxID=1076926 RepID=UPI001C90F0DB|nr:hypothetical protein [Rhizobium laguerreae]MBY3231835.1 hypothetical protein [Rhizobium laguerreae]